MGKSSKQPIISFGNIMIGFLVVVAIIIVFLWGRSGQNEAKEELKEEILSLQEDRQFYVNAVEEYTPTELNNRISQDEINVKESFNQKKEDIIEGLTIFYEETETVEDYENLSEKITPYLGESYSETLIQHNEPMVNESGEAQFSFEKLDDVKVAYGEYNFDNHTVDVFVLANYQSPELGANNPGFEEEDRTARITGTDFFILNYDLENDSLELVDYQQEMDSEVFTGETEDE